MPDDELEPIDPRVVRRKADGLVRLTFLSHLRVVRCGDGRSVRERDRRAVRCRSRSWRSSASRTRGSRAIDDRFWITYVAVSRHGAATALASTADFRTFERHGIIFCVENKDVVLFPERVGGEYVALHRPNGATPFTPAGDVAGAVARPASTGAATSRLPRRRRAGRPAASAPARRRSARPTAGSRSTTATATRPGPARSAPTPRGPCCSTRRTRLASCGAPRSRSSSPTADFERKGFVPDVVFPTGIVETGDSLLVYYGAADACTAVVEFCREELMGRLH